MRDNNQQLKAGITPKKVNLKIFFLVIFSLLMPTIAGVVIGVGEITDQASVYLIQFATIFIGCLILLILIRFSSFTFREIGFTDLKIGPWIIGIFLIELVVLVFGFHSEMDAKTVVLLVLFMSSVGVFEELVYRGFVLKYLSAKNPKSAIFVSAALFGVGHIVNLLSGADVMMTIVQIIFAFLFGIVCAEIVLLTKNITMVMVWHTLHNIISQLTAEPSINIQLIIVSIQCVILIVLGRRLWKKL